MKEEKLSWKWLKKVAWKGEDEGEIETIEIAVLNYI